MPQPEPVLAEGLARIQRDIDSAFDALLPVPQDSRAKLYEAMRYAAIGGGKRLRPLLVRASADLFAIAEQPALRAGLAVECIHVYSLVHDDLPAMDDDDMRRGKPSAHVAYGEATAILSGDCLHDVAFSILADEATHPDPFVRCELVAALAQASGPGGMAGGQMMDLAAETEPFDLPAITRMQQLKTGALIGFCVEAGAIMARIPPEGRVHLHGYARDLGLAFQIADDLMDVEGDPEKAGKTLGKDVAAGKATFVSLLGIERAREQAHMLVEQAIDHLRSYGPEADLLRQIAEYTIARDS